MKIPESISALVYDMKYPWMWILLIWGLSFLGLVIMPDIGHPTLAFFSCASLAFVGAMPLVENEKNTSHNILGVIAAITSQVWCCLCGDIEKVLLSWLLYLLVLTIPNVRTYWCLIAELLCLYNVFYMVLI